MRGLRPQTALAWAVGSGLLALSIAPPAPAQIPSDDSSAAAVEESFEQPADEAPPAPATATVHDLDIDALLAEVVAESRTAPAPDAADPGEEAPAHWLQPELLESWLEIRTRGRAAARRLMDDLRRQVPDELSRALEPLRRGALPPELQAAAIQVALALLAVLLTLRLMRGRGDIDVCIEYPAELRGTFKVRLSTRKPRHRPGGRLLSPAAAERAKRKAGTSSRTEHHMISRETQFRDVRAQHYWVTVDGFLQAPGGEEVLATHLEDRETRVQRGRTVRVEFDFHSRSSSIDAKVVWDRRPVPEALVAVRGAPSTLRFARTGPVRIGVHQGNHTLMVGSGDRVAEHRVEVASCKPTSIEVDLADRESLLFTGCPPAVEPYLHGDIPAAARALEREGQTEIAHLMLARLHQERGERESAARHFEKGGKLLEAAELRHALSQFEAAAELFERADENDRAAEMYQAAGDMLRAGHAYQRAGQHELAVECFREAGDTAKLVEALEKCGTPFEAAKVSLEEGNLSRAIQSLQRVTQSDTEYLSAANLLADVYQREGHLDLAIRTIEQIIAYRGEEDVPLEDCDRLAKLLEQNTQYDRALEVLEVIRRRDVTYPDVAPRIESLRKRQTASEEPATRVVTTVPDDFGGGSRYDILEEVGRGGMGVVFKARDRRLGRVVALKRLTENLRNHPKAVELFLREARSAAALNHPNIVTVFDAGQEGDAFYITMELLEGAPLQKILDRQGRLGPRDTARLGLQIAAGLEYAEEQRIVHRDIKTANLFFTNKKVVKIMDFGLAKMVEEVRRSSTMIGGTPYYMAPEQSLGKAVDHRADLYALGVTFFELLTGDVPFSEGDVAYHHRHTPPPNPGERVRGIPEAFSELILHMMAKKPEDRCGSAAEVRRRLQEILRS